MTSKLNIGKNIWYTSFHRLFPAIITFVFWFLTARIAGPEVIGLASTITSLVILISGILMLDVYLGMKRPLGLAIANGDHNQFKQVLYASILFITLSLILTIFVIALPNIGIMELIGIDREYLVVLALIIPAYCFNTILAESLVTMLRSKSLIIPMLLGTLARFPILFFFIFILSYPSIGTIIAYFSLFFISTSFYWLELFRFLKPYSVDIRKIITIVKELVVSGLASWFPHIINVLGSQLSLISVFTFAGSVEAGKFYLPMSIFTLTLFVVNGITRVIHPLLSGMTSNIEKDRLVIYSTKMAFILTMPFAAAFLLFPGDFLGILGPDYRSGSLALSIFMIGVPAAIISEIYYYYVYSSSERKLLLYLGLIGNLPRLFLYFVLVPWLGLNGSAIAYVVGSFCQLVLTIRKANSASLRINYKEALVITLIPIGIGSVFLAFDINFLIATFLIFVISLFLNIRFGYFKEKELTIIVYSILSKSKADKVHSMIIKIYRKLR